jgi:predicted transposase YbfD/YdcC
MDITTNLKNKKQQQSVNIMTSSNLEITAQAMLCKSAISQTMNKTYINTTHIHTNLNKWSPMNATDAKTVTY